MSNYDPEMIYNIYAKIIDDDYIIFSNLSYKLKYAWTTISLFQKNWASGKNNNDVLSISPEILYDTYKEANDYKDSYGDKMMDYRELEYKYKYAWLTLCFYFKKVLDDDDNINRFINNLP